jgi:hypothetical protein
MPAVIGISWVCLPIAAITEQLLNYQLALVINGEDLAVSRRLVGSIDHH